MTNNLYNAISHASHRRPPSLLKDSDYDHEIDLVDHTTRSQSADPYRSDGDSLTRDTTGTTRTRNSEGRGRRRSIVKREVERKRWSGKWTEDRPGERAGRSIDEARPSSAAADVTPSTSAGVVTDDSGLGSPNGKAAITAVVPTTTASSKPDSAIDILYENERGGFLCGMPLFSSRALGFLDPAPWTNIGFKASATSVRDAQVPDPSWEWAWEEWRVNHDPESSIQDEEGWEYAFMFARCCGWHGPRWWDSFVRRRAWIRMRVRREEEGGKDGEYFTVRPRPQRSLSPRSITNAGSRPTSSGRDEVEVLDREDIRDIGHLMKALKDSRIDREKLEVVENFVQNGGDDLVYLEERMHDVMGTFVFQASRRLLLVHLSTTADEATERLEKRGRAKDKQVAMPEEVADVEERARRRIENLRKAAVVAEEEVKRLEF